MFVLWVLFIIVLEEIVIPLVKITKFGTVKLVYAHPISSLLIKFVIDVRLELHIIQQNNHVIIYVEQIKYLMVPNVYALQGFSLLIELVMCVQLVPSIIL